MITADSLVVLQSYRHGPQLEWLGHCQKSVMNWAQQSSHEYIFLGDELFQDIPDWAHERAHGQKLILSDWGRLAWMRRLLHDGARAVAWIDFDVTVFGPDFLIETHLPFSACAEWWIQWASSGNVLVERAINNCVLVARQEAIPIIDFLLEAAALKLASVHELPDPRIIGTALFTNLGKTWQIPQHRGVVTVSPGLLAEIASGSGPLTATLRRFEPVRPHAANLCGSFADRTFQGVKVTNDLLSLGVQRLRTWATGT